MNDVIIIGGGLSGLTTAHLLQEKQLKVQVIEANNCLGGRIKTVKSQSGFTLEMGATWVFNDPFLRELIQKLNLELYSQYLDGKGFYEMNFMNNVQNFNVREMTGGQEYHKVVAGTIEIIEALKNLIDPKNIEVNSKVVTIHDQKNFIEVITDNNQIFKARNVVVTIPPKLLASTVQFIPKLSESVNNLRLKTHTWMADSIKFSIEYKKPFWRQKGLAGYALSNVGVVREIQDHVNENENLFGLVGFLQLSPKQYHWTKTERKDNVVKDLIRLLGAEAANYIDYEDKIWANEYLTSTGLAVNDGLYAHQFNGNSGIITPEMNNKLFFAGAETSIVNPGYMEGAVKSAFRVTKEITSKLTVQYNGFQK